MFFYFRIKNFIANKSIFDVCLACENSKQKKLNYSCKCLVRSFNARSTVLTLELFQVFSSSILDLSNTSIVFFFYLLRNSKILCYVNSLYFYEFQFSLNLDETSTTYVLLFILVVAWDLSLKLKTINFHFIPRVTLSYPPSFFDFLCVSAIRAQPWWCPWHERVSLIITFIWHNTEYRIKY